MLAHAWLYPLLHKIATFTAFQGKKLRGTRISGEPKIIHSIRCEVHTIVRKFAFHISKRCFHDLSMPYK